MNTFLNTLFVYIVKIVFSLRYRIRVNASNDLLFKQKGRGTLFLSNHPTLFIDPAILYSILWPAYRIRFAISAFFWYKPYISQLCKLLNGIPVPRFTLTSNSYKRHKTEEAIQQIIDGLQRGENFLIYPAGGMKTSSLERIGGASGVQRVLDSVPDVNVVMVRIKGLWGSRYSNYYSVDATLKERLLLSAKTLLKNFIFFAPRRDVIVDFELAAPELKTAQKQRSDLNHYLERWFNQPDGLSVNGKGMPYPGDSLVLVPDAFWEKREPPTELQRQKDVIPPDEGVSAELLEQIPDRIKERVVQQLAEITELAPAAITPEKRLSDDLGMDSLDIAAMVSFLYQEYNITKVPLEEVTTVGKVMAVAAGVITFAPTYSEPVFDLSKWSHSEGKRSLNDLKSETIPELFLNQCAQAADLIACADVGSGLFTYAQLKVRVLLLADKIRHFPGEHVGILLPSSVVTSVLAIACQLAGKVPVMINWTIGPRHLKAVRAATDLQVVLSSWLFLDRLENANLDGIEDVILLLEDVRNEISFGDRLRAFVRSKSSTRALLSLFSSKPLTADNTAVLLFTSGSENLPKGVPLTHKNLISNMRGVMDRCHVVGSDINYLFLPPFHTLGFLLSVLSTVVGVRCVYTPDPTDGPRIARGIKKWGITILLGAPTFVIGILKAAEEEELKTLRICVVGAEASPPELLRLIRHFHLEDTLAEGYGVTECSPIVAVNMRAATYRGVGKPLLGVEVAIVDRETFTRLPSNCEGLIFCRGENVFSGYLNKESGSPFVLFEGESWYNTGDIGFLDAEGGLTISGRLKRFVKVGGEMVSLPALEKALEELLVTNGKVIPNGKSFLAMIGDEESGGKTRLVLCTTVDLTLEEVNRSLTEAGFSNLLRVSHIYRLSVIPLQGSGKVNYRELQDRWNSYKKTGGLS